MITLLFMGVVIVGFIMGWMCSRIWMDELIIKDYTKEDFDEARKKIKTEDSEE